MYSQSINTGMNEKLNMTIGGETVTVRFTKLAIEGDEVVLRGQVVRTADPVPAASPISGIASRPRIRSYSMSSALIRLMSNGEMVTGAITHCTDRAWRVLNLALGACWIPRNIIRWSEIAGQFCVVEQDWEPDWCTPTPGLDEYPSLFDPDAIIPELNIHTEE